MATDYFQQYSIQFVGLSDGEHHFEFEIEDQFFASIPNAVVPAGNITVDVLLTKQPTMLTLHFHFKGSVETVCDRCAVSYPYPVEGQQRLIIKLGDEPSE
ncbi:MAG: YceD family protein, partial [Bacteroidia bacterium]